MSAMTPIAGLPAPASPTFGMAPPATSDGSAADHAAPADAFSALLARLLPGRVPIPLSGNSRVPGAPANEGESVDDPAGLAARDGSAGDVSADGSTGAAARTGLVHGVTGGKPGPSSAARTRGGAGNEHLLALAAAVAAMAGDTETAARLAAEVGGGLAEPGPLVGGSASDTASGAGQSAADLVAEAVALAESLASRIPAIANAADSAAAPTARDVRLPTTASTPANPAVHAAAAQATAARAAAAADPTRVENSLEFLHPEFRVRLERVITRMSEEHGHDVDIVETLRHQLRQNHLYEQGRSRPGDVVTWTRSSNHTTGGAADVIVDGSYANPEAYARLQRIAAQEGLRTLGARDPGHLELPLADDDARLAAAEPDTSGETRLSGDEPSRAAHSGGRLARPARVAAVADLARVATPAVARVATPGAPASDSVAADAGRARSAEDTAPASVPAATPAPAPEPARFDGGVFAGLDAARSTAPTERVAGPALTSGAAERIAHLLDMQSSAPMKPLSQVFLRVDGPDGQDRIRLDLRGGSLSGSIDLNDPVSAERLGSRIGDLHRALERHGLEAEALKVRTTPRADLVDRLAFAAPLDAEGVRSASQRNGDSASQRERSPEEQSRDEPREGSHDARRQNRKDNPGGRNS